MDTITKRFAIAGLQTLSLKMACGRNVRFEEDEPQPGPSGTGPTMDQTTAKKLFEVGATLVMLDVPIGTEIGIDVNSWNSGEKFKGIKMIPPGIHFVYWR